MSEIPGGDLPICDTCNEPIVGPVFRVGVERFCKLCKESDTMAWPKVTIEDFRLKTEGTDLCWIEGCEESQRQRGLCKKHYDRARHNRFLTEVVAQIDARSEAPMSLEQVKEAVCKPLPSGAVAIVPAVLDPSTVVEGHSESEGPILFRPATDPLEWRIQEVEAELRALKEALAEAVGAHPEPLNAMQQVALLQGRIEALTTPSGEVLLSEEGIRERYARLNEIGHAEDLLKGLSEPLQKALRAVLEEQKAQVLRVCP